MNYNALFEEYNQIMSILKNLKYNYFENLHTSEFKVDSTDDKKLLEKLNELKFFTSYINSELLEDLLMTLEYNPSYPFSDQEIIIKLDKDDLLANSKIDFLFFDINKINLVFEELNFVNNNFKKINFGVFKDLEFETKSFKFLNLLKQNMIIEDSYITETDTDLMKIFIEKNGPKYNYYNNIFSYIPINDKPLSDYQKIITSNIYVIFFSQIAHKVNGDNFDIRGKKKITIIKDDDFSQENYIYFVKLIEFLFSNEKFLEKITIIKNVFSRYIHESENFSSIDQKITEIYKTTYYYFEKYVQEDLEDFFKNRDVIFKEAVNVSKSINEQNDKITGYINASLISFLILLITFTFKNFYNISFWAIQVSQIGLLVFSFCFYYFISSSANERYNTTEKQFNLFLDKMGIIQNEEKEEIIKNYLVNPNNDLDSSLYRIKQFLIIANGILYFVNMFFIAFS